MDKGVLGWFCAALLAAAGTAWAGSLEDGGRAILGKYKDSLVAVTAVLKVEISGMSESQEQELETMGTVIDASGLIVCSDTSLNPLRSAGEIKVQGQTVKPRGTTSRIKVRYADGTEATARQVYSDADLDLTFLVPDGKDGAKPPSVTPVPLEAAAKADVMDFVISIGRLPKAFNWEPSAGPSRVTAITRKPRVFYFLAGGAVGGLGTPVFTEGGQGLGILTVRRMPSRSGAGQLSTGGSMVIVPAADVIDLAKPALEAAKKAEQEAKEEKKDAAPASATEKKE
jgi:hypothetical protein